jgi:hypothetical protein
LFLFSGRLSSAGGKPAWEYVRNDAFDAHPFFANLNGQKKPELRYNTFGFNLGGPVPKIGHEKKTFFFYNQEWRRLVQGSDMYTHKWQQFQLNAGGQFNFDGSATGWWKAPCHKRHAESLRRPAA